MDEWPWDIDLALQWLARPLWTPKEATAIFCLNGHPRQTTNASVVDCHVKRLAPFFRQEDADSLCFDAFDVMRNDIGLTPARWIDLHRMSNEPFPAILQLALDKDSSMQQPKALRRDKLLTHQRIMVALSKMGPVDLEAPGTAQKIMQKQPGRSLDVVTKAIKEASRAVKEDDLRQG